MIGNALIREIHVGKVLDNDDPLKLGGLKVQVDTLVHGSDLGLDDYIPPCFPFAGNNEGFWFIPEKDTEVEIEVVADPEGATEDLNARWRAVLYSDKDAIPEEFLSDPTKRGGIKFGDGKILVFDKTKDLIAVISNNVRLGEEDCIHPLVRGDVHNTELDTYLTQETTWVAAELALIAGQTTMGTATTTLSTSLKAKYQALADACTGPLAPLKAIFEGMKADWETYEAAAQAMAGVIASYPAANAAYTAAIGVRQAAEDSWLSTKCKTE